MAAATIPTREQAEGREGRRPRPPDEFQVSTTAVQKGGQVITGSWRQYKLIVGQGLRAELADKERMISPILFAITILLLFSFALGEVEERLRAQVFTAETYLTGFFALQLSFSRLFEPERDDRVFDLMRSYPISHAAWFLAKYTLVIILGLATLLPTMVFGAFLLQGSGPALLSWPLVGVAALAVAGLAALGVLLSVMTLKAHARQLLYPLLYFPLTTPVLLAAVQTSLIYLEEGQMTEAAQSWMGLLTLFNVIYFTLALLLYSELLDDT